MKRTPKMQNAFKRELDRQINCMSETDAKILELALHFTTPHEMCAAIEHAPQPAFAVRAIFRTALQKLNAEFAGLADRLHSPRNRAAPIPAHGEQR